MVRDGDSHTSPWRALLRFHGHIILRSLAEPYGRAAFPTA
jgi:hypothetical protein